MVQVPVFGASVHTIGRLIQQINCTCSLHPKSLHKSSTTLLRRPACSVCIVTGQPIVPFCGVGVPTKEYPSRTSCLAFLEQRDRRDLTQKALKAQEGQLRDSSRRRGDVFGVLWVSHGFSNRRSFGELAQVMILVTGDLRMTSQ